MHRTKILVILSFLIVSSVFLLLLVTTWKIDGYVTNIERNQNGEYSFFICPFPNTNSPENTYGCMKIDSSNLTMMVQDEKPNWILNQKDATNYIPFENGKSINEQQKITLLHSLFFIQINKK